MTRHWAGGEREDDMVRTPARESSPSMNSRTNAIGPPEEPEDQPRSMAGLETAGCRGGRTQVFRREPMVGTSLVWDRFNRR